MPVHNVPRLDSPGAPTGADVLLHLQRLILSGSLVPGERLPGERDLASHLGISRALLRETLGQLEARRLVSRKRGSGTTVTTGRNVDADLIGAVLAARSRRADAAELRVIIETRTAELAATRMTPETIRILGQLVDGEAEALDAAQSIELDTEFHSVLARATGNQLIDAVTALLTTWTHDIRRGSHSDPVARRISMEGHREIYEAIEQRNPEAARAAMHRHLHEVAFLAEDAYRA